MGCLRYINGELPCPPATILSDNGNSTSNQEAHKWLHIDQLVLGWLNSYLSNALLSQVINCETFLDAWEVLKTLYRRHTDDQVQKMKGEFQSLIESNYSIKDYLHKAKSIALALKYAGKPIDEDDFYHLFNQKDWVLSLTQLWQP